MNGKVLFLVSLLVLAIFVAGCSEQAGEAFYATKSPKIAAANPAPGSVSGLGEISPTACEAITWRWTNPSDTDLNRIEVRLNNGTTTISTETIEKTAKTYVKKGLTRDTAYTLFVTPIDTTSQRGITKQDAARTLVCAPETPPVGSEGSGTTSPVPGTPALNYTVDATLSNASNTSSSATIDYLRSECGASPSYSLTWKWTVNSVGAVNLTNVIVNGALQTSHPGMDVDTSLPGNQQEWVLNSYSGFSCGTAYTIVVNVVGDSGRTLVSATNSTRCPC